MKCNISKLNRYLALQTFNADYARGEAGEKLFNQTTTIAIQFTDHLRVVLYSVLSSDHDSPRLRLLQKKNIRGLSAETTGRCVVCIGSLSSKIKTSNWIMVLRYSVKTINVWPLTGCLLHSSHNLRELQVGKDYAMTNFRCQITLMWVVLMK